MIFIKMKCANENGYSMIRIDCGMIGYTNC